MTRGATPGARSSATPGARGALATIVVPAFDAEATILRAVRSALAQTAPVEVVVVDDASRDRTAELAALEARSASRLRLVRQERNRGPSAARNAAIAASSAPWIALLDADDWLAPDRIERLLAIAEGGAWDFVADDVLQLGESNLAATPRRLWSDEDFGLQEIRLRDFVLANISGRRGRRRELGFVKPMMRRSFLQKHGLSYDETLRLGEDYDLYARALARGARFGLVDPLGYYAVARRSSLSGAHATADLEALLRSDRRLLQERGLSRAERAAVRRHVLTVHKEWAWRRLIDAVKARDAADAARCFLAPAPVAGVLAARLAEQAWLRAGRRLRQPRAAFGDRAR